MKRSDRERLVDIARAIARLEHFIGDLATASISGEAVRDAVLYNLLVIGEAAKSLGADVHEAAPEVPWRSIAGMRDVLAHHYFRVDAAIVEATLRKDLPQLKQAVARLLPPADPDVAAGRVTTVEGLDGLTGALDDSEEG